MTSGIEKTSTSKHEQQQLKILRLLDRQVVLRPLDALIAAIKTPAIDISLQQTAIGFDANVFLRLAHHPKIADIVDYLSERHVAPIILPGQAIQEFWNNQLQVVDTVASGLKKKFDIVKTEFNKVDQTFGDYASQVDAILEQFISEHGHVYDDGSVRKTLTLLDMLQKRARVPFVHRLQFDVVAAQRKRTKTPPGFRDEGDGDFFIWVDFLKGLLEAQDQGEIYKRAVLVTNDKKVDWSRHGSPHPILVAEIQGLLDVHFEIWSIEELAKRIGEVA